MATETESHIVTFDPDLHARECRVLARPEYLWALEALEIVVSMRAIPEEEKARIIKSSHVDHALNRPIRTRTADVPPAFRCLAFKRAMLPTFRNALLARSPLLLPAAEVDAAIAARVHALVPAPKAEPDFTAPEPMPIVDAPEMFAREFWKGRKLPSADAGPVFLWAVGRPPQRRRRALVNRARWSRPLRASIADATTRTTFRFAAHSPFCGFLTELL